MTSAQEHSTKQRSVHQSRVVVFDQCPLFRQGLVTLLDSLPDFKVVKQTSRFDEVIEAVEHRRIDFLVIDMDEAPPALDLLHKVKSHGLACRCVMTMTRAEQSDLMTAIRLQGDGFLSKRLTEAEFAQQFMMIRQGHMVISDALTNTLASTLRNGAFDEDVRDIHVLSAREHDVLCCMADGMTNHAISQALGISDGTVKVHVKHILKKLKFATRVEAALWASKQGLHHE